MYKRQLNAFYHSRYVNTVKALAKLYIDTGCYEKLEQLCTRAIVYERSDEQIYSYPVSYTHLDVYKRQTKHRAEVIDVCITEYDEQAFVNGIREEGRQEGRQEGRACLLYTSCLKMKRVIFLR